jgi:hypothetical protein
MNTLAIGNSGVCQRKIGPKYGCIGIPGIGATAWTSIPTTVSMSFAAGQRGIGKYSFSLPVHVDDL